MAGEERDAALELIETTQATSTTGSTTTPPPKPVCEIRTAELASKGYLESEADIEAFLSVLKQALHNALAANKKIRIR
jgi:hypothetical protein